MYFIFFCAHVMLFFFFFQAEDGIRDIGVTGVQTCALPICTGYHRGLDALRRAGWKGFGPVPWAHAPNQGFLRALHALGEAAGAIGEADEAEIGRASCRERV